MFDNSMQMILGILKNPHLENENREMKTQTPTPNFNTIPNLNCAAMPRTTQTEITDHQAIQAAKLSEIQDTEV